MYWWKAQQKRKNKPQIIKTNNTNKEADKNGTKTKMKNPKTQNAKNENLKGVGVWALGYDEGHDELWGSIEDHFLHNLIGDLNFDNILNIQDIILLVNIILNTSDSNLNADLNNDGSINILDIVVLVNLIL